MILLLGHWLHTPLACPSSWEVKRFCKEKLEERQWRGGKGQRPTPSLTRAQPPEAFVGGGAPLS